MLHASQLVGHAARLLYLKWVTWRDHAHFRDGLSSVGWDLLCSTHIPNLKCLWLPATKIWKAMQNVKITIVTKQINILQRKTQPDDRIIWWLKSSERSTLMSPRCTRKALFKTLNEDRAFACSNAFVRSTSVNSSQQHFKHYILWIMITASNASRKNQFRFSDQNALESCKNSSYILFYHSSASPVLTATSFVNGKGQSTPIQNQPPSIDHQKFVAGDYVSNP